MTLPWKKREKKLLQREEVLLLQTGKKKISIRSVFAWKGCSHKGTANWMAYKTKFKF